MLAAISATFITQNKSFSNQEQVVDAQENARAALQLMTKELLMAGYDPSGKAGAGVEVADSDRVQFTMDINSDGDCEDSGERIIYTLDTIDNQVERKSGRGTPVPIGENIQSLSFTYFDSDGNQLTSVPLSNADKANVTRVSVEVTRIMPQSANFNRKGNGENIVRLAYVGAVQVWKAVAEVLTPSAFATNTRALKDSVSPPNLGKTRTASDYETAQDETWSVGSSSSSSS